MKQAVIVLALVAVACVTTIALILSLAQYHTVSLPDSTQYGIVFDAGSSHTSLFLYKWPGGKENNTGIVSQQLACEAKGDGISSYAQNPRAAGQSLKPCLDVAMTAVPKQQHGTTPIYLGATAGMRLLRLQSRGQADQIIAEVVNTMQMYPFDFRGARILTGAEEGAYGWITVNYLLEGLIKYSFEGRWDRPTVEKIVGALDLGGASTQISFSPSGAVRDPAFAAGLRLYGQSYELYTHSYLCYGKDQAMTRLLVHLLEAAGSASVVSHPCYHLGYKQTLTLVDLYDSPCVVKPVNFKPDAKVTFIGTSESQRCLDLMEKIVNLSDCTLAPDCGFNATYQPQVHGKFYAFSGYYYTFDFLGLAPQAPLPKVISTIDSFCNKTWAEVFADNPNVREQFLREYCAASHYIMTILLRGYKFNETWDQIFFQKQVADSDIGWTLGYMLNLTNLIPPERPLLVTGVRHSQWGAEVFFIVFALTLSLFILIYYVWSQKSY